MSALRDLINANPDALAAVQARDDAAAATLLNTPTQPVAKPGSRLTELGAIDVLIMAHAMAANPDPATAANNDLTAVEAAATAQGESSLLARAVRILKDIAGGGLDFGNLSTQGMIVQLRDSDPQVLSTVGANALLAYGSKLTSAAETALGREVTANEISMEYVADRANEDNANNVVARYEAYLAARDALAAEPENPVLQQGRDAAEKALNETFGGLDLRQAHQQYLSTKNAYENPELPPEYTQEEIDQAMAERLAAYQAATTQLTNTLGGTGYIEE